MNPLKTKRKVKTTLKMCSVADAPSIKAEETPTFVKNCTKNLNPAVALASANNKSAKTTPRESEDIRYTLDRWKLYIDSCATYQSFFVKEFLRNIENGDTPLTGSCNAGITFTHIRGW